VASKDTCTLSRGQFSSRRGIGASAGSLPQIGLPAEVQRDVAATPSVARPKPAAGDGHRPLERDGGNIVGAVTIRLIGAVLLEANDEWQLQHRYMQLEAMAEFTPPMLDPEPAQIPPLAA
jgi:hypothetical protein